MFTAGIPDSRDFINLWARDGSFAGSVPRVGRIDILDDKAILSASGKVARAREAEHYAPAREYRAEEAADLLKGKLYNASVLPGLTPAIRETEQREFSDCPQILKRRKRIMEGNVHIPKNDKNVILASQAARFARQAEAARKASEDSEIF